MFFSFLGVHIAIVKCFVLIDIQSSMPFNYENVIQPAVKVDTIVFIMFCPSVRETWVQKSSQNDRLGIIQDDIAGAKSDLKKNKFRNLTQYSLA